ncbi:hypothetical protein J6590_041360 [Homalodisca vitripennis]|nr:hypothetical protein J6590_041360 [Homalodisca vitripennis]
MHVHQQKLNPETVQYARDCHVLPYRCQFHVTCFVKCLCDQHTLPLLYTAFLHQIHENPQRQFSKHVTVTCYRNVVNSTSRALSSVCVSSILFHCCTQHFCTKYNIAYRSLYLCNTCKSRSMKIPRDSSVSTTRQAHSDSNVSSLTVNTARLKAPSRLQKKSTSQQHLIVLHVCTCRPSVSVERLNGDSHQLLTMREIKQTNVAQSSITDCAIAKYMTEGQVEEFGWGGGDLLQVRDDLYLSDQREHARQSPPVPLIPNCGMYSL